jgi:DNA-binding response OmpR family regulator
VRFSHGLVINYSDRTVYINEKEIVFSKIEFDILELLSMNPKQVFDKERIYERVWGLEADGDNTVVKEHIRKIRSKFLNESGVNFIETVWGVGYKWGN